MEEPVARRLGRSELANRLGLGRKMDVWEAVRIDNENTLSRDAGLGGESLTWLQPRSRLMARWGATVVAAVPIIGGAAVVVGWQAIDSDSLAVLPQSAGSLLCLGAIVALASTLIGSAMVVIGRAHAHHLLRVDGTGVRYGKDRLNWRDIRSVNAKETSGPGGPNFSLSLAPSGGAEQDGDIEEGFGLSFSQAGSGDRNWAVAIDSADGRWLLGWSFSEAEAAAVVLTIQQHRPSRTTEIDPAALRALQAIRGSSAENR